ncbi:MAG TPA: HD-GYP domain-containing protein [Solirubrobacterales bacterium]|jgi:putative nucleotidyltransferase with HDIG domain|nr:HD-GYP domain-containing protein [Solirubrobacterales bacterium]
MRDVKRMFVPLRRKKSPATPTKRTYWQAAAVATTLVVVLPAVATYALQSHGLYGSLMSVAFAVGLSLVIATIGSALWSRCDSSRDIIFSDLMLWGWIRRVRTERRLAGAASMLGGDEALSNRPELLKQLSVNLEARDFYTQGHSSRVARHAEAIAVAMGLPREEVARIRVAAAVHDVGKVKTPREVLNKPGKLSDSEYETIKLHPVHGAEMVALMRDDELTTIVRHHHERLDGKGYPDGLVGSEIPIGSRIIAVADTFDAITSSRPYRSGARHKVALDILRNEAGTQLDPDAVNAFLRYYSGKRSIVGWSVITTAPPRLVSSLVGSFQSATTVPITQGVAVAGIAAVIGGASVAPVQDKAGPAQSAATAAASSRELPGNLAFGNPGSTGNPRIARGNSRAGSDTANGGTINSTGPDSASTGHPNSGNGDPGSRSDSDTGNSRTGDDTSESESGGHGNSGGGSNSGHADSGSGNSGSNGSGSGSDHGDGGGSAPKSKPPVTLPDVAVPDLPIVPPLPNVPNVTLPNLGLGHGD